MQITCISCLYLFFATHSVHCHYFSWYTQGNDRDFARFFVLETVARVPYFAYLSVLHLRETFGQRTTDGTKDGEEMSDRMRTHYAEADNELVSSYFVSEVHISPRKIHWRHFD